MLYQINDGTLSIQGNCVLSHADFEIKGKEKIAVVGSNGAGKTTFLRLIAGELSLDADDKRKGQGITFSEKLTVGILHQQSFLDKDRTVEEELMEGCPSEDMFDRERFFYEKEYDRIFTGFGFGKADKTRKISEFSGGEQTKIALIRLLLMRPDILLLDEPTNHLDMHTVEWLEEYLRNYDRAVVIVSHDRFFLDETAEIVYELEDTRLTRYAGNYTEYRRQKEKNLQLQQKAYERYIEEKERLEQLIERFKRKPNKAAFARAKKKALERLPRVEQPRQEGEGLFAGSIDPLLPGSKKVFEAEELKIGYDRVLLEVTLRIRRGQKIAILGDNGVGKSTFLKTAAGRLEPLGGKISIGNNITIGYFDQHSAEIQSDKRIIEQFHEHFPSLTDKEARAVLGAFLFGGADASKRISDLSGGEKVRFVLAELLTERANFLLLDEPTNHCDIRAKERLEQAFRAYSGTMLFISHDRYFVQEVADAVLIFEGHQVYYYPFGYRHYLEKSKKGGSGSSAAARVLAEDQALIEDMRAVPKAERHRLREISTEEAYKEWKLLPVLERLKTAEERWEQYRKDAMERIAVREASEEYWDEIQQIFSSENKSAEKDSGAGEEAVNIQENEWISWHEACLEWYDLWAELEEIHL